MAKKTLEVLKQFFLSGKKPSQEQFEDTLDSFVHKDDPINSVPYTGANQHVDLGNQAITAQEGFFGSLDVIGGGLNTPYIQNLTGNINFGEVGNRGLIANANSNYMERLFSDDTWIVDRNTDTSNKFNTETRLATSGFVVQSTNNEGQFTQYGLALNEFTIGSNVPNFRGLRMFQGDIEITDPERGYILKSPNGTRWRITISDDGRLLTSQQPLKAKQV